MRRLVVVVAALIAVALPVSAQCVDLDGDGYGNPASSECQFLVLDCNDASAAVHPGAEESCNAIDDDCDAATDELVECRHSCPHIGKRAGDSPVTSLAARVGDYPDLVWTGSIFGVAWWDARHDNSEVYFRSLMADGTPLGDELRVTNAEFDSLSPSVAWTGSEFALAWADTRDSRASGPEEIYFGRVSPAGMKIGEDIRVSFAPKDSEFPILLWSGVDFGVVWQDDRSGYAAYFSRLSRTGMKLQDDTRVDSSFAWAQYPTLAWTGAEYGIAWNDGRQGVYFTRIDRAGNTLIPDRAVCDVSCDPAGLAIAWNGTEFAIAWGDARHQPAEGREVYLARLTADGDKIGNDVRVTHDPANTYNPALAWIGDEWILAFTDDRTGTPETYVARVDRTGVIVSPESRVTNDAVGAHGPSITWTGSEVGLLWLGNRETRSDVFFARLACDCPDDDGDTVGNCGDCAANDGTVYPAAPEICDGKDNDCDGLVDAEDSDVLATMWYPDADGDGFGRSTGAVFACAQPVAPPQWRLIDGDCDDSAVLVYPSAVELCNAVDDDCDGSIDEDFGGDSDGDSVLDGCDNCPAHYNADQANADGDSIGNACDNCMDLPNDEQIDTDHDGRGDVCDNCPQSYNPLQDDSDHDRVGDVCDNCVHQVNESQHDLNGDQQGDECDLDDGLVIFGKIGRPRVRWQSDPMYSTYNLYRGSLVVLRATGEYTQKPGSNHYAGRFCGLTVTSQDDALVPATGEAFYWLVTGVGVGGEEPLGDGAGVDRPNTNPCP